MWFSVCVLAYFFFFKQKTAYELRISDWSSDVCSSDLSASGAPSFTTKLVVRFREDDIDGLAAALGLPVWPAPRPKPVLWLAIDDGSGPRLVALAQNNVARSVLQRAKQRGYSLGLPSGSAAEQAAVGAIWRGDTAAIPRLSSRSTPPLPPTGTLYRRQGGRTPPWNLPD